MVLGRSNIVDRPLIDIIQTLNLSSKIELNILFVVKFGELKGEKLC